MSILITGVAGFIGYHLARRLCRDGQTVLGVDNINDYYDPRLKEDRLSLLSEFSTFRFMQADIADRASMERLFANNRFDIVVNLAAQPGVRYSLKHPETHIDSNVVGFANILEGCRHSRAGHLVYASSSSVYGLNTAMPYSVASPTSHPASLYAATKRANELMAHAYSHVFGIPTTGLRFFTVYGPWGRPDMAYFLFTRAIIREEPITVYNQGRSRRDFTYIDDVVETIARVVHSPPGSDPAWLGDAPDPSSSSAPYRLYNIGSGRPVDLMSFISLIERQVGRNAKTVFLPLEPGDVPVTWAETVDFEKAAGLVPATPLETGITAFVEWYRAYYGE
ncbi:MAG: NAD-dependent epimerase [Thermodesulfobacteriota bacterium]